MSKSGGNHSLNALGKSKRFGNNKSEVVNDNFDEFLNQSDQEVWLAFKEGNEAAYVFMYQKYFADLINYGRQFARNEQLIEDCVQDLFIDLKKSKENLTNKNTSIKFYLFKSLKRRIIEYRKKVDKVTLGPAEGKRDFEIVLPEEALLIEKQFKEEQLLKLSRAVEQLTTRQREVLYYLFYAELSYEEIREIMGFDHVRSVRNIFYKALDRLKTNFRGIFFFNVFA